VTTTTVNASNNDGEVFSLSTVLASMQSGTGFTVTTTATSSRAGMNKSGPNFQGFQFFLDFDTSSIPDTDVISSVTLSMVGDVNNSTQDFVTEVYTYDFSTTVTSADWQNPTQIGALTLVASRNSSAFVGSSTYEAFTSEAAFLTEINKTGSTRLLVTSDRFRTSTTPAVAEFIAWNSSNDASSAKWPKLEVVHDAAASDVPPLRFQSNVYRM
jgi:hypothetical protein